MLDYLLLAALVLLVTVYIYGTTYISYCILKSAMFENWQKAIIVAMCWLIPIVGPAFVYRLLEEEIADTRKVNPPFVTWVYLSPDMSWAYGKGSRTEADSSGSASGGGDST